MLQRVMPHLHRAVLHVALVHRTGRLGYGRGRHHAHIGYAQLLRQVDVGADFLGGGLLRFAQMNAAIAVQAGNGQFQPGELGLGLFQVFIGKGRDARNRNVVSDAAYLHAAVAQIAGGRQNLPPAPARTAQCGKADLHGRHSLNLHIGWCL